MDVFQQSQILEAAAIASGDVAMRIHTTYLNLEADRLEAAAVELARAHQAAERAAGHLGRSLVLVKHLIDEQNANARPAGPDSNKETAP